tara:strand:+ start:247 stop:870 length:624 start_codon:yes stop_codon:yes gene_type:complete
MPSKNITFTGDWDKISGKAIASAFTGKLKANVQKATRLNAMLARKAIRRKIQSKMPPPNAPLTAAIKGSTKPLVDKGQLFQAITFQVLTPFTAEVGVRKGDAYANIAVAIHEGATIPVTPAMRGLFAALANASDGKSVKLTGRAQQLFKRFQGWKALKSSTTQIVIPPRRFVQAAIEDKALKTKIYGNWQQALAASITGKPPVFKAS